MRVNLDCVPCMMHQALKTARFATEDEAVHAEVLKKTAELMARIDYSHTPPELAHEVHRIVREVTENPDPYQEIKRHDNQVALKLYPELKDLVSDSPDPLHTAVKLAVAGNIIDYGVNSAFDLEETIDTVLKKDFARDDFSGFRKELESTDSLTYLADNAGELVFDRILIEELKDKKITLVVKGGPIINDATREDARQAGLEGMVELDLMGNGVPETGLERNDPSFLEKLRGSDLVLSKGQGNYEGLSFEPGIYFLLMAKCPLIAKDLGVKERDIVFCKGR